MKTSIQPILFTLAAFGLSAAAATHRPAAAQMHPPIADTKSAHSSGAPAAQADDAQGTKGTVVETMNAGPYTYVQVDDGANKIWAAAPKFNVAVGDKVVVPSGAPMQNFESKTLGRTFDLVYFVDRIQVEGGGSGGEDAKGQVAAAHGGMGKSDKGPDLDFSGIKKADGGHTVAELYAQRADLVGKEVAVRGKVAKFTPEIMGKNWVHLRDGTGDADSNDLTVTTNASVKVGDTVLVRGKLATDKNLGFGYEYAVIVEEATLTVE